MKIDILTIFPKMFESPFSESILRRAQDEKLVNINVYDLRKWTSDKHKTVDDTPFGGGAGMIMKIEPIYKALEELDPRRNAHRVLLTAKGARIVQEKVRELSKKSHLILICGRYEGVDHRVHEHLVDECISIGDFVLTGGEIPAMAVVDAVVRLIPGVLGNVASLAEESFSIKGKAGSDEQSAISYLEYPQFTRPEVFRTKDGRELKVPTVLLSGDHEEVAKWRRKNKKCVGI
jgi:tRNA (guanine37-N1)-methyltransferase